MVTRGLITLLVALTGFSCLKPVAHQGADPVEAQAEADQDTTRYVLTGQQPTVAIPLPPLAGSASPSVIELTIGEVVNPQMTPVSVTVLLEQGQAAPAKVGAFSLYPANQPGVFLVDLGKSFTNEQSPGAARLSLRLLEPQQFSQEFRLTVKGVRWGG